MRAALAAAAIVAAAVSAAVATVVAVAAASAALESAHQDVDLLVPRQEHVCGEQVVSCVAHPTETHQCNGAAVVRLCACSAAEGEGEGLISGNLG